MRRLQGKEFAEMRPKLEMLGYQVSNEGNIKAIMKLKTATQVHIGSRHTTHLYSHWLNPQEVEKFKMSTYFKLNKPLTDEQIYGNTEAWKNKKERGTR